MLSQHSDPTLCREMLHTMPQYNFNQPIARKKSWKWQHENVIDGHTVIPMSVADMDFISPYEVTAMMQEIVDNGMFGYCSIPSEHEHVIAKWQQDYYDWDVSPNDILITNGLLVSMFMMIKEVSEPEDSVVIFSPVYQNFVTGIKSVNRTPKVCNLLCDEYNNWTLDFATYEKLCREPTTTCVIICNPHNPVGRAWTVQELDTLIRIAQEHNVIIFSDEIHSDFVFDTRFNPAIKAAKSKQNVITFSSGGKVFNIGGLYSSFAITQDKELKNTLLALLKNDQAHPNTFSLWASYAGYKYGHQYRQEVVAYIRRMQEKMATAINQLPLPITANLPEATYFLWADFGYTGWNQKQIQEFLIVDARLGFIPGDRYGQNGEGFVRINCAVPEFRIDEAIQLLEEGINKRVNSALK